MPIAIIAAVAKNNVIGKSNTLPWYIPEDLKRFRALTIGKTVLMGRKTFESIIKKIGAPLPKRKNVIITKKRNYQAPKGVVIFYDLKKALEALKNEEVFIIGGAQIYQQTIDLAETLYITHIDKEIEGDVFFPEIDLSIWKKITEDKREGFSFALYKKV